jgi:pyrroloquinoline quinone (PQQ) biosynthesis protein C
MKQEIGLMTDKKVIKKNEERILARTQAFEIPEEELKNIAGGNNGYETPGHSEHTWNGQDLDYHMN